MTDSGDDRDAAAEITQKIEVDLQAAMDGAMVLNETGRLGLPQLFPDVR